MRMVMLVEQLKPPKLGREYGKLSFQHFEFGLREPTGHHLRPGQVWRLEVRDEFANVSIGRSNASPVS